MILYGLRTIEYQKEHQSLENDGILKWKMCRNPVLNRLAAEGHPENTSRTHRYTAPIIPKPKGLHSPTTEKSESMHLKANRLLLVFLCVWSGVRGCLVFFTNIPLVFRKECTAQLLWECLSSKSINFYRSHSKKVLLMTLLFFEFYQELH